MAAKLPVICALGSTSIQCASERSKSNAGSASVAPSASELAMASVRSRVLWTCCRQASRRSGTTSTRYASSGTSVQTSAVKAASDSWRRNRRVADGALLARQLPDGFEETEHHVEAEQPYEHESRLEPGINDPARS